MALTDPPFDADDFPAPLTIPYPCTQCGACDDRTRIGGLLCLDCFNPIPAHAL